MRGASNFRTSSASTARFMAVFSLAALPLVHELLLLVGAALDVVEEALDLEVLRDEGLERVERAAARVVGAAGVLRVEVLDRGVAAHVVGIAERLARGRAVSVADDNRGGTSVLVSELVPSRLHRLAVPSPGRKELDEGALARDQAIEVLLGHLDRTGMRAGHEGEHERGDTHPRPKT